MTVAADFDGVVLGAGASGLMAALRAAAGGARIALVDPAGAARSNLVVSSGLFSAAGTRQQAAAGIEDSPARWAVDITRKAGGAVEPGIVEMVVTRSADVVDFLTDRMGLAVTVATGLDIPGHSARRLHEMHRDGGEGVARLLFGLVQAHPGITVLETEAVGLLVTDGAVRGAETGQGAVRAPWTLLAMGGYGGNRAMLRQHAPEIMDAVYIGLGANDGRAHGWGQAVGGTLAFMDSYQGQGHTTPDRLGRLGPGLTSFGAIVVNDRGERFADESMGPSEFGAHVLAQPGGTAVELFDDRIHAAAQQLSTYRAVVARGLVAEGDADAIAAAFGLPEPALRATLAAYARVVDGEADRFGRRQALYPLAPPYRAARVTGALAHTQGGLLIDRAARVRRGTRVVPGLLASGACAAGISGHGAAGYLPGNGLGHAFALGLVAGETMARRLPHTGAVSLEEFRA